jgi:hypothetical protein
MRFKAFHYCMLIGAGALGAVALYYFINYAIVLNIALDNSGVQPGLQSTIRALWLAFAFQALLIGLLYALVAFRPRAVSREVIVLFGLLQLLEAVLLFWFAGSMVMMMLLVVAAVCVLCGAVLWPTALPPATAAATAVPAPRSVPDARP